MKTIDTVRVGPFHLADVTAHEAVEHAVDLALDGSFARFYALHVGGLNHRSDSEFVSEMNDAELLCADGGSVVLLAKAAGAHRVERVPTTDIGHDLLESFARRAGRPARIALIGGPQGLAERAADSLTDKARPVFTTHGYHEDFSQTLAELRGSAPDIVFVGMGAPREMLWVSRWRDMLPSSLFVTCGGWFGFLAGEEKRAPSLLRKSGIEWIARLAQQPARLAPRYARGIWSTAALLWQVRRAQ